MIWQNDGRRSDLLVSWGAVGKTERVKHKRGVWYGNAREQSFTPRTKPLSPSFARHFSCCIPTNFARWTRDLLAVQVGTLAGVMVVCSCVRNIFGNLSTLGYFKMDDAKVPGQPEETCRGILQWTSVSFRGNNNTSHTEAGIASMIYAYLQSLSLQNLASNLELTGGMAGFHCQALRH